MCVCVCMCVHTRSRMVMHMCLCLSVCLCIVESSGHEERLHSASDQGTGKSASSCHTALSPPSSYIPAALCLSLHHSFFYILHEASSHNQLHSQSASQQSSETANYKKQSFQEEWPYMNNDKRRQVLSMACLSICVCVCVFHQCWWTQGRCADDLYKGIQSSDAGVRCDSLKELASVSTDVTFAQEFISRDGHLLLVKIVEDSKELVLDVCVGACMVLFPEVEYCSSDRYQWCWGMDWI